MARNNNKVGWNSIQHKDLLNLITTIKKTDPDEFRAIYDAAHNLLDKYTNPEVLSQEIKDVLNGFSNPWRFDHDNNHVIVDGSISGKDLALSEDYGWNTKENKAQKKKREEIGRENFFLSQKHCQKKSSNFLISFMDNRCVCD
jgi:hypothetical protein